MARFIINGYGQIELNNVAWPRDGRVEAQSTINADDFSDGLENGMIVKVDGSARELIAYDALGAEDLPWAVVYSSEKSHDPALSGLKNFKNELNSFLPRAGYPSVGDKWTTNVFSADDTEGGLFADASDQAEMVAVIDGAIETRLFAVPGPDSMLVLTGSDPGTGPLLRVLKRYTMPDGSPAIQVQVVRV